jgi:hypothetical protein
MFISFAASHDLCEHGGQRGDRQLALTHLGDESTHTITTFGWAMCGAMRWPHCRAITSASPAALGTFRWCPLGDLFRCPIERLPRDRTMRFIELSQHVIDSHQVREPCHALDHCPLDLRGQTATAHAACEDPQSVSESSVAYSLGMP